MNKLSMRPIDFHHGYGWPRQAHQRQAEMARKSTGGGRFLPGSRQSSLDDPFWSLEEFSPSGCHLAEATTS